MKFPLQIHAALFAVALAFSPAVAQVGPLPGIGPLPIGAISAIGVPSQIGALNSSGAPTSFTATGNINAHDLACVIVGEYSLSGNNPALNYASDPVNGHYTRFALVTSGNVDIDFWCVPNALAVATPTITLNWSTAPSSATAARLFRVSGMNLSAPADKSAALSYCCTNTSWSSGTTSALSQANELVIGFVMVAGSTSGTCADGMEGSGFTTLGSLFSVVSSSGICSDLAFKIVNASTGVSYSPSTTATGNNASEIVIVYTLKGLWP